MLDPNDDIHMMQEATLTYVFMMKEAYQKQIVSIASGCDQLNFSLHLLTAIENWVALSFTIKSSWISPFQLAILLASSVKHTASEWWKEREKRGGKLFIFI